MEKSYIDLKNTFKTLRSIDASKINQVLIESTENDEDTGDAVPYTKNDEMMSSILEAAKTQFGASFEGFKNPMLYYPNTRNVTLCGMIPSLNNLKFQFSFLEPSESVFVWSSPLYLNDKSLNILNRMNGVFKNWINELKTSEDIKPMSLKNKD